MAVNELKQGEALPYQLEERDGVKVRVYQSGVVLNDATKKIVQPAPQTLITSERTPLLHRQRQEKTAALLRSRIREAHNDSMPNPVTSSSAAFAEAGAMLYEQIVLNSEAYPRDRMEAWKELGKHAQVLSPDVKQQVGTDQTQAATAVLQAGTAQILLRILEDVRKVKDAGAVEGTVNE